MLRKSTIERPLFYSIILNGIIAFTELAGGLLSNSLALISDALHNFSDFIALIISFIAARVIHWENNEKKSYGYFRVEILAAFINATALVLIGVYIIYEAFSRIYKPEHIHSGLMIIIAAIGFAANMVSVLLLHPHKGHNLNAKSAFLHLATDAAESAAVIVVAILISLFNLRLLDPLVSILIGLLIIKSSWDLLLESANILTEGAPKGINVNDVAEFIKTYPGVKGVHHLHIWSLSTNFKALSAHIVVDDMQLSRTLEITNSLDGQLSDRFGINHPTFQLEADPCEDTLISQYRDREPHGTVKK